MITAFSGSPPQVTVVIRSGLNQIKYSPSLADKGAAIRPLATERISMKEGSSIVSDVVTMFSGARLPLSLRLLSSHAPMSRIRCVLGTSPTVVTWPSNNNAPPLAPSG